METVSASHSSVCLLKGISDDLLRRIRYSDGSYVLEDGTRCSGLLRRLAARVPGCERASIAPGGGKKHPARWRTKGSSIDIGKRIDAELVHAARCLRGRHGLNIEELATLGTLPACIGNLAPPAAAPGKTAKRSRKKATAGACANCGLQGERYGGRKPRWHHWTIAYLRDVGRKNMRLVASQVPVADAGMRVATELDDILVDAFGSWVVVERKSGYIKTTDTGARQITFRCPIQLPPPSSSLPLLHHRKRPRESESGPPPPKRFRQTVLPSSVSADGRAKPPWQTAAVKVTRARYESNSYLYGREVLGMEAPVAEPPPEATTTTTTAVQQQQPQVICISSSSSDDESGGEEEEEPCVDKGSELRDVSLPASEYTLHQLQVGIGTDLFVQMATAIVKSQGKGDDELPAIRRCVVYVSGRSKIRARDRDGSLECVWVWDDSKTRAVAAALLPTLG